MTSELSHASDTDHDSKRLVLALESGIKREVAWALNTLAVLSFGEKDTPQREQTVLTKVPGIISALLHVVGHPTGLHSPSLKNT